ncbi:MAG: hypothetical protein ACRCT8_01810 [Lacipirellulaceae bacterium]
MIAARTLALLLVATPCFALPVAVEDSPGFQAGVDVALRVLSEGDRALGSELATLTTAARRGKSVAVGSIAVQTALDRSTQLEVEINPESRVKVAPGGAACVLTASQWNYRLAKVVNLARVTAPLRVSSPQCREPGVSPSRDKWLDLELFGGTAPVAPLTGAKVEYRVVRIRPHAVGKRAAVIAVDVGQGTADIGFRNDVLLTFTCVKVED